MNALETLLSVAWFFLPAYVANMAPVFALKYEWFSYLDKPVDFGKKFRGQPLFGPHKTIRGFVVGILGAYLALMFQYLQFERFGYLHTISILPYDQYNLFLLGVLFGFGALFGDLVKSFIKRRQGIKSGEKFIPFDQIDYTLGAIIFVAPVFFPGVLFCLIGLVLNTCLHFVANGIGYMLGIKDVWW